MTLLQKIIYIYLNTLARVVFRIYFKSITIKNKENIPLNTPTLVAPNHPNTMIDPVMMASIMPGWIHFLANYGLFKHPISKFLMTKVFFSIPVKRPKDVAPGEIINNLSTIKNCSKVLGNGGTIFMGPEATSYTYRRVRPLKDGIARIALTAAKSQRFKSNLVILPIGTNYSDPTLFRSEIILQVGEPIYLDDFKDDYKKNKSATSEKVLKILKTKLESLSIHTEDEIESQFLTWLETIGKSEGYFNTFEKQLEFDKERIPSIRKMRNEKVNEFQGLWHQTYTYFNDLKQIDSDDFSVKNKNNSSSSILNIILFPFYFLGKMMNIQWFSPLFVFDKLRLYRGYSSMIKVLTGVIIIPLVTMLFFTIIAILSSFKYAVAYLILSLVLGLFVRPYERRKVKFQKQKNFEQSSNKEAIIRQRRSLVAKLKEIKFL